MRNGATPLYLRSLFEHGVTSALTDGQLLERFAARSGEGSELAFAALVDRHGTMVFRTCQAILRDEHEAMDAFQATFLLLAHKGRSLWVRDSLAPWLYRVACRAARRAKALARRRQRLARRAAELGEIRAYAPDHQLADLATDLHEEINGLPERYRSAIVLCELEGCSLEEAARLVKCPVGTLASRLARGRQKLRDRLTRRGVSAALPALGTALSSVPADFKLPLSLTDTTVRLVADFIGAIAPQRLSSAAAVALAQDVSRSLLMTKLLFTAAVLATLGGVSLVASWAGQSAARPQAPVVSSPIFTKTQDQPAKKQAAGVDARPDPRLELLGDPARYKDYLMGTVGNMRPLTEDNWFQSRLAVLYKDGTAKLWSLEAKDPIVPPLRHEGPIREVAFIEQAKLLITTSDNSVKIWDALSGELRKTIDGEVMRPLVFSDMSTCAPPGPQPIRFVTIDTNGRFVTTWDATTLDSVGVFRPEGTAKLLGAGLTRNGRTLATIAEDRSVTLWAVAQNQAFATLRPPSPLAAQCFVDEFKSSKTPTLRLDGRFWEPIKPLIPPESGDKK